MAGNRRFPSFVIQVLLTTFLVGSVHLAAVDYDEARHADGSLHYKIKLDRDGQRDGKYVMYQASGSEKKKGPKAESGSYVDGKLHGERTIYDDKGKALVVEHWLQGRLTHPRGIEAIKRRFAGIASEAKAQVASLGELRHPNAPSSGELAATLARVNEYRFLCGLADDVVMSDEYIYYVQCGAELLQRIDKLTHTPKNPGMEEQAFKDAYAGTSKSNLFNGRSGAAGVDGYMDDSDKSNRSHLGHRRWILWPDLAATGTGSAGRYSGLFVIGKGKKRGPQVKDIPFPPRGFCPLDRFGSHYVWSFSASPKHYTIAKDAKLVIYPFDMKTGKRASRPLSIAYANLAGGDHLRPPAVCALPERLALKKGASFEVVVEGVRAKTAPDAEVGYVVTFY